MSFFFSRDTKVFMKWSADGTTANTALYEIPVLDGFSFSQATNTTEVTLNEAATSSGYTKRGSLKPNNTAFAPETPSSHVSKRLKGIFKGMESGFSK